MVMATSFSTRFWFYFLISSLVSGNDFLSGISSVLGVNFGVFEAFHAAPISNQSSKDVDLGLDQAYLNVSALDPIHEFLELYGISKNCYKCPRLKLNPVIRRKGSQGFVMDTRWPFNLFLTVFSKNENKTCSITFHFGEKGYYMYKVEDCQEKGLRCALIVTVHPINSFILYTPDAAIVVAAAILLGLTLLVIFIKWLRRSYLRSFMHVSSYPNSRVNSDLGSPSQTETIVQPVKKRLLSLDAFRGLSLTLMVFVNFGGGGYWFFKHSKWNGLTVADLVFPWFIFIMGVSLALSFRRLLQKDVRKSSIFAKIVRRTLILFALGLLLNKGTDLSHYRIPGVLQRFAFSYFVVASLELFLSYNTENTPDMVWWYTIREIIELWKQWIVMLCLLSVYLILTYAINIPECSRGYVGPGGIGEGYPEDANCTGGMAGYIDKYLFGENHIYGHPTSKKLYHSTVPYDPEGALGALTSAFLTFLGLQAGKILVSHTDHVERERRLITWAMILGFIAIGLCGASKNDGIIPLNKNIWSLSFVLATGAMAFALLAFCYLTIDDKKWWDGTPFIFPGMNSIFVYCGHEVLHSYFPFNWTIHPVTHGKKLAMNVWGVSVWVIIAYYCYKIDFFVKI